MTSGAAFWAAVIDVERREFPRAHWWQRRKDVAQLVVSRCLLDKLNVEYAILPRDVWVRMVP